MPAPLVFVLIVGILVALDLAALRWGVDSRPALDSREPHRRWL